MGLNLSRRDRKRLTRGSRDRDAVGVQVTLAEYAALRAEVDRRANVQWNILALQITSTGVIASLAISRAVDIALLLVIPLLSYMLGSRYIIHEYHINLISTYIRDELWTKLHESLSWEIWKKKKMESDPRAKRMLTTKGWRLLHPTRLAFEGVALLALVAGGVAIAYAWWTTVPKWDLALGLAFLWTIAGLATYILHRSFSRAPGS
jgi:hypothetical protein